MVETVAQSWKTINPTLHQDSDIPEELTHYGPKYGPMVVAKSP
jgi:hypothetical protein